MPRKISKVIAWSVVAVVLFGLTMFCRGFLRSSHAEVVGDGSGSEDQSYQLKGNTIEVADPELETASIKIAKAETSDAPMALTVTGKTGLNMETVTHVSALFGGRITDIHVGLGDTVKGPGDVDGPTKLCVIESNDLAQAKSNWLQALIQVKIDEQALVRSRELFMANVLAEKFLIDAESQLMKDRSAQEAERQQLLIFGWKDREIDEVRKEAAVEAANAKAGGGGAGAASEKKSTEQIRRERMGYVLTAPRSGVIAEKVVAGGETAIPQTNLFTIADTHTLWVWGDVYERDLSLVKRGQPIKVFFTSEPDRRRECTVDWISPVLDPTTHSIKIRGLLDNSDGHLLSDMYGTMMITVSEGKNSVIIPADAVVRQDDDAYVFVLVSKGNGKTVFRRTAVKIASVDAGFGAASASAAASSAARNTGSEQRSSGSVRVADGLKAGDLIVIDGGIGLFNEMKEQESQQKESPTEPSAVKSGSTTAS